MSENIQAIKWIGRFRNSVDVWSGRKGNVWLGYKSDVVGEWFRGKYLFRRWDKVKKKFSSAMQEWKWLFDGIKCDGTWLYKRKRKNWLCHRIKPFFCVSGWSSTYERLNLTAKNTFKTKRLLNYIAFIQSPFIWSVLCFGGTTDVEPDTATHGESRVKSDVINTWQCTKKCCNCFSYVSIWIQQDSLTSEIIRPQTKIGKK